jgi:hypothetical protein
MSDEVASVVTKLGMEGTEKALRLTGDLLKKLLEMFFQNGGGRQR